MQEIEKTLAKIITFFPPFSIIISGWEKIEESNLISTFATDGKTLIYNKKFLNELAPEELAAVLLHEIFHCVFLHPSEITKIQRENKIPALWEIACEIVCNAAVKDITYNLNWKLPGQPVSPLQTDITSSDIQNCYFYDPMGHNHTAAEIYLKLEEMYQDKLQLLNDSLVAVLKIGSNNANLNPTVGDIIPNTNIQDMTEKAIATLEILQKQRGSLPGTLSRFIERLKRSKIPWSQILLNFVGTAVKGLQDYSWIYPNWRHPLSKEIIIPGMIEYKKEDIIVVIDTSGSISQSELNRFASEVAKLTQYTSELTVITCDTQINEKVKIKDAIELIKKIKFKGGGGTDFTQVFKNIKNCLCMIFFTDGMATYPKQKPNYPVLWILTKEHTKPPFGRVAYIYTE